MEGSQEMRKGENIWLWHKC